MLELVGNNYDSDLLRLERDYLYRQCGGITLSKRECYFDDEKNISGSKGHIILSRKASLQVKNKFDLDHAELHLNAMNSD